MNITTSITCKGVSIFLLISFLILLFLDVGKPVCENPEELMTGMDVFGVILMLGIIWLTGYFSNSN